MRIRYGLIGLMMMACTATAALADVHVSLGFNLPVYPRLVAVPGYPVYYAPGVNTNYFFYDGLYWVFEGDSWYQSSWYNGPWVAVDPFYVPAYVLRVPVRYYRHPPVYFRGWRADAAPHWGEHWGRDWEQRNPNWNRAPRGAAPVRAPLPTYQRQYSGNRYPQAEQQQPLHTQNYRYQPRDEAVRQHVQPQRGPQGEGRDRGGEGRGRER
ncbi:MAG: hypothetical protein ACXWAC_01775 [Usitatibacter sp.]